MLHKILPVISNIKKDFSDSGLEFPKLEPRMFRWLALLGVIQKKFFFREDRLIQMELEDLINKFAGYMVALAYDDPVDDGRLDKACVYDQLSRCLAGFSIGAFLNFPCTLESLTERFSEFEFLAQRIFNDNRIIIDLELLLAHNKFLENTCPEKIFVGIADLYYTEHDSEMSRHLNITIHAAYRLGQIYKKMKEKLRGTILDPKDSPWHQELIIESLLKSGYAQANTTRQLSIDKINLGEYLPIATWKSNSYIDLISCVRSMLDRKEFQKVRLHNARFCEQIIDDIMDFSHDCKIGLLGFIQLRFIEQGRLALYLIDHIKESGKYNSTSIDLIKSRVEMSCLLTQYFDHVFIFKNPIFSAARDNNMEIIYEESNIEAIIREALTNSPDELKMNLNSLLVLRSNHLASFNKCWNDGEFEACQNTLIRSSIPAIITKSLIKFSHREKNSIISGSPQKMQQLYYYFALLLFLNFSLLKFSAIRCIMNMQQKFLNSKRSSGINYEETC